MMKKVTSLFDEIGCEQCLACEARALNAGITGRPRWVEWGEEKRD